MGNLKKIVSYIVSHPRNRFKGNFTTHSSLDSVRKTSSFLEVGTGICPSKTILAPYYSTLCSNREKLLSHRGSISESCDNGQKVWELSAVMYNTKIRRLCDVGLIDMAAASLEEMVRKGFKASLVSYTMVIDSLFKMGGKEDYALKLFKEMAFHHGILPNPVTYSFLLHGIRALSRLEDISQMLIDMEAKGILVNLWTYNIFVDAYCKEGRVEDAESLVKLMRQGITRPNVDTYKWIIDGYCSQGKLSKAREVLDGMRSRGVIPNVHVYNILLNGYCKDSKMEEAMHLFYELRIMCLKHKAITYDAMGLLQVGRCTPIEEFLSVGPMPNECTYKIILEGLCNNNQVVEAVSLFLSMGDTMLDSKIALYNILIDGAIKSEKLGIAKILYNGLTIEGLRPDAVTYAAMINGLCREGLTGEANQLFLEMKENGFMPNEVTCNILLLGIVKNKESDLAQRLFVEMKERGFAIDASTSRLLFSDGGLFFKLMRKRVIKEGACF